MTLRRLAFAIGLLALALLVGFPFAERRAVGRRLVEDAMWAASSTFERPSHRPSQLDGSVSSCLDARLAGARLTPPPLNLQAIVRADGGAAWLEEQRTNVAAIRECLREPRVGPFDSFGSHCLPADRVEHSRAMLVASSWLRLEVVGLIDGGSPLEACLDAAALERDGPALDGFTGAMVGAATAAESVGGCVEALTRATPEQRKSAEIALELIKAGQQPASTMVRIYRTSLGVTGLGVDALGPSDLARLPTSARACVRSYLPDNLVRARTWFLLPSVWKKLTELERLSITDPLLESPMVGSVIEDSRLEAWLHDITSEFPRDLPRLARRYANVSRKADALLALLQALDGRTPPTFPWMKLSVTDTHVHLELKLNDLWKTFDVDR